MTWQISSHFWRNYSKWHWDSRWDYNLPGWRPGSSSFPGRRARNLSTVPKRNCTGIISETSHEQVNNNGFFFSTWYCKLPNFQLSDYWLISRFGVGSCLKLELYCRSEVEDFKFRIPNASEHVAQWSGGCVHIPYVSMWCSNPVGVPISCT